MLTIRRAESPEDHRLVRALFEEYAASLGFDLDFQDFQQELAELPGRYSPPAGCILVGESAGQVVGCVALRRHAGDIAEMKRLYVKPSCRGQGAGRKLAEAVIAEARERGYTRMRLDTVASMGPANALYRSLGFVETERYRHNPLPDALFFERAL